jgi:NhaP-type Na+/H+ or K+/H+ antiporter
LLFVLPMSIPTSSVTLSFYSSVHQNPSFYMFVSITMTSFLTSAVSIISLHVSSLSSHWFTELLHLKPVAMLGLNSLHDNTACKKRASISHLGKAAQSCSIPLPSL